jgi:hypothetical protein
MGLDNFLIRSLRRLAVVDLGWKRSHLQRGLFRRSLLLRNSDTGDLERDILCGQGMARAGSRVLPEPMVTVTMTVVTVVTSRTVTVWARFATLLKTPRSRSCRLFQGQERSDRVSSHLDSTSKSGFPQGKECNNWSELHDHTIRVIN